MPADNEQFDDDPIDSRDDFTDHSEVDLPEEPDTRDAASKPRKKPGRQTHSAEEVEERVEFAASLLAQLLTKGQVKKAIYQRYDCSARTAEDYISRARARVNDWKTKSKVDLRAEILGVLTGMFVATSDFHRRLAILDRVAKHCGFEAATQLELSGRDGGPIEHKSRITFTIPDNGRDELPDGMKPVALPDLPPAGDELPQTDTATGMCNDRD